jgi:hypothetical protein
MLRSESSRQAGTIILSEAARRRLPELKRLIRAADGSLDLREGNDFVIGRWKSGDWEPGMPLRTARAPTRSQHTYVPVRGQRMLRLTHA